MIWTVLSAAAVTIWRVVTGQSGLGDTLDRLSDKLVALRDAKTEVEKAEIEREIVQLKAVADLQRPSSQRRWGPMQIGQYLIVVPFGLWWGAVCAVSILDPYVARDLDVQDLPPHIFDMAWWLIPLIVGGTLLEGRR